MALSAEDRLSIVELTSRYAMAMDDEDIEAWLSTWAETGLWEGRAGKYEGHDKLRELLPDLGDRVRGKRHVMANFVLDGNDKQASQRCYLLIFDRQKQAPPMSAVYDDKLEKMNGQWRFVHRRVQVD